MKKTTLKTTFRKLLNRFNVVCITSVLISNVCNAQTISPDFFGQNAWMPDTVGNGDNCPNPPCILYGKLHEKWSDVRKSGAKLMRYGGINPDRNMPTRYQYIRMIDSMRVGGIEPILQVPFYNYFYTPAMAADIVKYINITKGKKVKYWAIANEPDKYGYTQAQQIAVYIKSFSTAMKAVDPTIKIIAPEIASYNSVLVKPLTTPGGQWDITGKNAAGNFYIDIFSFHCYPFSGSQSRDDVIEKLTSPYNFDYNLGKLNGYLNACNTYHKRTGENVIKPAVTEANINYLNITGDNLYTNGANSFIGGQFWAELMGIAMKHKVAFVNFFSVLEGKDPINNIGYICGSNDTKKPSFYHYKLMSDNFRGSYCHGKTNSIKVKSFGCKNESYIVVVVMNQRTTTNYNYTVKLDTNVFSDLNPIKININAGINKIYKGSIKTETTQLLIFDVNGNILRKYEYGLKGEALTYSPPSCTPLSCPIKAASATKICKGGGVMLNTAECADYQYRWKRNDTIIIGATKYFYFATTPGNYKVSSTSWGTTVPSTAINVSYLEDVKATILTTGPTQIYQGESMTLKAATATGYHYQWKKDGVSIEGATASSYVVKYPGSYQLKVTKVYCSDWSNQFKVNVLNAAKTSARLAGDVDSSYFPDDTLEFKIYPNPNRGLFNFELSSKADDMLHIRIGSILGEIVYSEDLHIGAGLYQKNIDMRNIPAGVYLLQAETSAGVAAKKIVIQ